MNDTVLITWHTTVIEEHRHDFTINELSELLGIDETAVVRAMNTHMIADLIRQVSANAVRDAAGSDADDVYEYVEESHHITGIYPGADRPADARI